MVQHPKTSENVTMSPRCFQSNVLVTIVMIAMGQVETMALVANMAGDHDPLAAGIAACAAGSAYIHEDSRLNGYANTHLLSHHFVPPFTINRVIQRPNPPMFCRGVPTGFCPTLRCPFISAPQSYVFFAITLARITVEPGDLPEHFPSPVDAGDLGFTEVPSTEMSGRRPSHPSFQVVEGQGILTLHADLRYCESVSGDLPLPMSVTYRPNDFPALREHWMVDSGTSASCTPNRGYFSNYVPCALFLTDRNGA
ncbi:hypothetical protein H257_19218 [Aphanomyces astaci]|uniref:Uncharacterized protein n=1 Tax=Aphanomyces astaci TaxID=112090 RepID=W4F8N8_APHAT|nr:hypothetical protein H257_19218 [Aphanomyces astaci]ETV63850.1 hypothetical protein H257_19218 [Aphanomyces astaci]|eukprot:XP_009846667.1 hypothetical protein H257_19218 [Aphanomyces astaci]